MAKILGITGLIGSGKSIVRDTLKVLYDIPCFDSDSIAKEIYFEKSVQSEIEEQLGFSPIKDGKLDKDQLKTALTVPSSKERLERIVHSAVEDSFNQWKDQQSSLWIAIESAILFTSGFNRLCDYTLAVYAPSDIRRQRVLERDIERSAAEFERIERLQSEERKRQREEADITINNHGHNSIIRAVESLKESITNI